MEKKKELAKKGEFSIYVLTLIDCIERLDTLVFEARNLQVNIIQTLREPRLYLPLRYEELYIFGQKYDEEFNKTTSNQVFADICGKKIQEWMINYPLPKECNVFLTENGNDARRKKLEKKLKIIVKDMWFSGTWGEEQRRYYHFLRAIQALKRKIFYDKTVLCHFAYNEARLFFIDESSQKADLNKSRALFLILRRAVLKRCVEYLKRLRDIQYQFSKAMDTGLQDNPRPNIERRRELGIYMNYLSDRCRDLAQEMTILLKHCDVSIVTGHTTILHSWTHDYTSKNARLIDNLTSFELNSNEDDIDVTEEGNRPSSFEFVNTNYWMPDRPDLQPIIAHEIGHGILRKHLDNLSDSAIQNGDDAFTELMLMLEYCIKDMGGMGMHFNIPNPRIFIREIACDFLGASTQSFSFLYAQFLDTVGFDLEKMLCLRSNMPEIGMIHYTDFRFDRELNGYGGGPPFPEWYFRLYLLTVWIKCIHHHQLSDLETMLIEGIRQILDNLFEHLQLASKSDGESFVIWANRKALLHRLKDIIEGATVVKKVKKWRELRSDDHRDSCTGKVGRKKMPRHVQRLPDAVIQCLFEQRKEKMDERLLDKNIKSNEEFSKRYGVNVDKKPPELFSRLYQIPWQSSLMRGIDFWEYWKELTGNNDIISGDKFWKDIHFDCSLGRDRFVFALDFYYWSTASPAKRLDRSISLIRHHLKNDEDDGNHEIIHSKLKGWLDDEDRNGRDSYFERRLSILKSIIAAICKYGIDALRRMELDIFSHVINKGINKRIDDKCQITEKELEEIRQEIKKEGVPGLAHLMEPTVICKVHKEFPPYVHEMRVAEEIIGYKLQQLCSNLEECSKEQLKQNRIFPLYSFLTQRAEFSKELSNSAPQGKKFLNAFSIFYEKENKKKTWCSYLLGRISASGSYIRPQKVNSDNDDSDNNVVRFNELAMTGKYKYADSIICHSSGARYVHQHLLLGRYDIIQATKACPMSRCVLPHFILTDLKGNSSETLKYSQDEKFLSFFVRREMAFPVRIHCYNKKPIELPWTKNDKKCLWAIIAITLPKRSYRLDLLSRLLKKEEPSTSENTPKFVEDLAFEVEDVAYLTDGWGDILLFLHGPNNERKRENNERKFENNVSHIKRIAKIHDVLFEDFMTDRTELIPTSFYLNAVAQVNRDGVKINRDGVKNIKFRIESRVRLMEDRLLWRSNKKFIDRLTGALCKKGGCGKCKCPGANFQLSKIPGRLDFHIHFTPTEENNDCRNFMECLINLLDHACVDRIDTSIGIEYLASKQ